MTRLDKADKARQGLSAVPCDLREIGGIWGRARSARLGEQSEHPRLGEQQRYVVSDGWSKLCCL